jgi:hypothetical protein
MPHEFAGRITRDDNEEWNMKNAQTLKEVIVKADEESLNSAIAEKQIAPESIISVMLQPGSGVAIGDSGAKYRVIYRA